jgi:hypothetical protein
MVVYTGMTIDEVLLDARLLLNDQGIQGSAFRFSNQILLNALNAALNDLYRYRPDAFIGNFTSGILSNNPVPQFQLTDLGLLPATALPVDGRCFYNPLVFYVAGRTELSDDEFTDTNRAMTLLTAFRQMLVGTEG